MPLSYYPSLTRQDLIYQLKNYSTRYSEEAAFVDQFNTLLDHPDAYERHHLPGHITGSAWIVDPKNQSVLLVHHAKLNKWLQPGGHSDGDENTIAVALKEAREETGIMNFELPSYSIFDIDIHPIPSRMDIPEHLHYDIRFIFYASVNDRIIVSEESHDVKWIAFKDIQTYTNNTSIIRMLEKVEVRNYEL